MFTQLFFLKKYTKTKQFIAINKSALACHLLSQTMLFTIHSLVTNYPRRILPPLAGDFIARATQVIASDLATRKKTDFLVQIG